MRARDRWGQALIVVALLAEASPKASSRSADTIESPRLASVATELRAGSSTALDAFWCESEGRTPLVEAIPGDDSLRRVTFLYRGGDDLAGIILIGPLPPEIRQKPLTRLPGSDIWFLTTQLPRGARFAYAFARSGRKLHDPLNPRPLTLDSESIAEMDDAPPQPWIAPKPDVPHGDVRQVQVADTRMKAGRTVTVYTPARGTDVSRQTLLILFDAADYLNRVPLPTLLDNLIAAGRVEPIVAVLVHNESQAGRTRDLSCSDDFAAFLAVDLVPWARRTFGLPTDPHRTIIGGSSLGGVAAACAALRFPDVFGNVLSQSGAFWYYRGWPGAARNPGDDGFVSRQYRSSPKVPVRFYLEAGLFETDSGESILLETRTLKQVLTEKGYELTYSEFAGGHDFVAWRGSLGDGLVALAGRAVRH